MKKTIHFFLALLFTTSSVTAQEVFWFEDFDSGGATRWDVTGDHPTPAGIPGLVYGVNAPGLFDYFTINDANTPELSGPIAVGLPMRAQGQFVRGHHYDCSAPSDLPNPFVNTGGLNNSLHLTSQAGCAGLIYFGTPGYDDWNCITLSGTDFPLTQTEQFAAYNTNIDATGRCNIKLTADFFLGGSANGLEAHSTILYSIDGGVSWKIVQDNLATCFHTFAGTCNDWHRRSFELPADANGEPDLRIAFRWTEDGNTNNNTQDYALGASFNVDNVMLSSCSKPKADFTPNVTSVCKNQQINIQSNVSPSSGTYMNCFTVLSDNCPVTGYLWNIPGATFVNGTSATDPDVDITFAANGTYTVELTVSNCGGDSIVTKTNLITVADCPPTADFMADNLNPCFEPVGKLDTVSFTDLSTTGFAPITGWSWTFLPATVTFVNGTTAASQHPQVTFDAAGSYQVSLQATSAEGSDIETKVAYFEVISCECGSGGGGPSIIWSEDFDGNGGAGSNWTTAPLNQDIGVQGMTANLWYISGQECGNAPPLCGSGCAGIDNSLHVSSSSLGDIGAAYDASSLCLPGCFLCDFIGFCSDVTTDRRSQSQNINTTGQSGLTLNFNYIEEGEGADDDCFVEYSTNGGASWTTLVNTAKSVDGACAPQGRWTAFSIALPAACDNINNLRIAFRWQNDADGIGSDPSFAVDDIDITTIGGGGPSHTWEGTVNNDWHTAGNWDAASVPTSADDVLVPSSVDLVGTFMPTISAAAVAKNVCNYGTITHTGLNTLTIDEDLLNEGVVVTDNVDAGADVIFANAASIYKGSGTMFDVDVDVQSSDFTLENDMTPRSFTISTTGTVDLATFTLSINKNLTKTAGTFVATNGEIHFIDACGSCVDATSNADVSMNANQAFGNVLVNKTAGVKTSIMNLVDHSFASPKTLTIQSGILDANANTVNGTGNLTMTGGEFQLAKNATALPELTGTYTLTAGQVTLDGGAQIIKSVSDISTNYFDLEFAGTGIKTFSSDNVNVNNRLLLSLPTGLGNYVNTDVDTLYVFNSATTSVVRTGGHIVGYLGRDINSSGVYMFYVGSDNAGGDTYYEPLELTATSILGTNNIVAKFYDVIPSPDTVINVTFMTASGSQDTVKEIETEGYWHLHNNNPILGGNYQASVNPSNYWSFGKPWATGHHALLKQDAFADPWDFTNGGIRMNDSTTNTFSDFSNLALAFTDSIIPSLLGVELIHFTGKTMDYGNLLSWTTAEEESSDYFDLERSTDGFSFSKIAQVDAVGNSTNLQHYQQIDYDPINGWNYYRLKQVDNNSDYEYSQIIALYNGREEVALTLMPNPATDKVTFDYIGISPDVGLAVEIFDVNGRKLFTQNYVAAADRVRETISTEEFPVGVYFVRFRNGIVQKSLKLVIID